MILAAPTATTACGEDESAGGGTASETTEQDAEPKVITVTIEGDLVTPNGDRIDVDAGQDVELDITADEPGEIQVHSTPEQELEYDEGKATLTITGLAQPGTVDVEVHELEKIIVQLEVR